MAQTASLPDRRPTGPERLAEVVDAAAQMFARYGYRRAQMADVARQARISPGSLYNYVESKDALFHLVLRRVLGEQADDEPLELPVPATSVAETSAWVARRLDFINDFPRLELALQTGPHPVSRGEVEAIVGELHDVLARMRWGVEMIQHSVDDLPELAAVFAKVRQEMFARYERYLRDTTAHAATAADPEAAAHVLIELCWWAAGRRQSDPHATGISDETARATVCSLAAAALTAGSVRTGSARRTKGRPR